VRQQAGDRKLVLRQADELQMSESQTELSDNHSQFLREILQELKRMAHGAS
jgi:hypothetical protein